MKDKDLTARLDVAVRAVCPIVGVSIGRVEDRGTWSFEELSTATAQQISDARRVIEQFKMLAPSHVKAECRRRILARFPEWKQANMTARGVELQDSWRRNGTLSADEQADADSFAAAWAWIKSVRSASDVIESLETIPEDYAADHWWPA